MKSITSCSLAPRLSWSWIWRRRSSASSALESASVWFWQTRQRSSAATAITRLSSSGSSDTESASLPKAEKQTAARTRRRTLFTFQLAHQRQHGLFHDLRRERPDALVADHAFLVDQVGFRNAVDAVVDANLAVQVEERRLVRI